jgi:hypothetical protein
MPITQPSTIDAGVNEKFGEKITEFEITVPVDYNHKTYIDTSAKKAKKEKTTYGYNDNLNSKNFANASVQLEPGKTYKVKIFPTLVFSISSDDCIAFLKKQQAILVGGQGLMLVYDQTKDKLPKGTWTTSLDEKPTLWKDSDGKYCLPAVHARTDGAFKFDLDSYDNVWDAYNCLLCFCDESTQ